MRFGIALGTNLGHRAENIRRAIAMLLERLPEATLTASAPVYETDPVDCSPDAQAFLNTVIELDAPCTPQELHIHLKAVESALGRPERRERNSPRTLDLDLLYADEVISNDPSLILPHPRLHLRRFVLQPLADIRPNLVLPGHSTCIADLLSRLKDDPSSVRRYS